MVHVSSIDSFFFITCTYHIHVFFNSSSFFFVCVLILYLLLLIVCLKMYRVYIWLCIMYVCLYVCNSWENNLWKYCCLRSFKNKLLVRANIYFVQIIMIIGSVLFGDIFWREEWGTLRKACWTQKLFCDLCVIWSMVPKYLTYISHQIANYCNVHPWHVCKLRSIFYIKFVLGEDDHLGV